MNHLRVSQSSLEHSFVFNGECEFWDRKNNYCTVGEGKCMHAGKTEECKMYRFYEEKLNKVRPKKFEERWKSDR